MKEVGWVSLAATLGAAAVAILGVLLGFRVPLFYAVGAVAILLMLVAALGGRALGIKAARPHRDTCKRGCGIVHSMQCEDACIVGGVPFICERAYSHPGDHEATGSAGWVASWTDDHPQRSKLTDAMSNRELIHTFSRERPRTGLL